MNKLLKFDFLLRILTSILYRSIILIYAGIILLSYNNFFPFYIYLSIVAVYVILLYFLIGKDGYKSKLRLIIDLTFIFLILYSKPIDNFFTLVFLLLPICNAPNYSGKKRSYLLLFILTVLSYYLLIGRFVWIALTSFFSLLLLNLFEYYRSRALNFFHSLNSSISELYELKKRFDAESIIYNEILTRINNSKFSSLFYVHQIIFLNSKEENYAIQNSSSFISTLKIEDFTQFKESVKKGEIFNDIELIIEKESNNSNLIVPVKMSSSHSVVFILIIDSKKHLANYMPKIRNKYFLTPSMIPFFKQLAFFFDSEYLFKRDRLQKFESIKGEYEYVLRTINAVHFLRNRLSPFKNYLEMSLDIRQDATIKEDTKNKLLDIIYTENESAKITLNEILNRVNQILDANSNPFNVTSDINPVKIKEVYSQIRTLVFEILKIDKLNSSLQFEDYDREIYVSKKGITIVFSDLISNIFKHSDGRENYNISFSRNEDDLVITFSNKYQKVNEVNLKDLIKYFESSENYNIFKMSSKGAFLVKDFLKQMNIKHNIDLDEKNRVLTIALNFKFVS